MTIRMHILWRLVRMRKERSQIVGDTERLNTSTGRQSFAPYTESYASRWSGTDVFGGLSQSKGVRSEEEALSVGQIPAALKQAAPALIMRVAGSAFAVAILPGASRKRGYQ